MGSNIELYHCNEETKARRFIEEEGFLIISNHPADDNWAGKGMYFWDNRGNAKYWYREKVRKQPATSFIIVKAKVSYTEETLMDLLDVEIESLCKRIIDEFEKKNVISNDDPLGKKSISLQKKWVLRL